MQRFCVLTSLLVALSVVFSCQSSIPESFAGSSREAEIWPDYKDVTIPCNIAPLNFDIKDTAMRYLTVVSGDKGPSFEIEGRKIRIGLGRWRKLLEDNKGGKIHFKILEKSSSEGSWEELPEITVNIAEETVDGFVAYRLIAPTYGMAGGMSIIQRNLASFKEKEVFNNMMDYDRDGGQCVNCHSFQAYGTDRFQFHVRQKDGGTVILDNGKIRKTNLKRDGILSAGVYPSWHPTDNLIAYSVNSTYQNFFSTGGHKTEVIDNGSDLILYDVATDSVTPILNDSLQMETFPYWAPDGKTLFFCQASLEGIGKSSGGRITNDYDKVHYNIMRIGFDPSSRKFSQPELVFDAASLGCSATFPRLSPDGRHLLFTMGDFGNFHIWHKESDLYMMDYPGGSIRRLENVNSSDTESYHSWSSDGRWIIFSSRREDGLYTRLYLAYFDKEGKAHKPFIIPRKDPSDYKDLYKSYNIPEFTRDPVRQGPKQFLKVVRK